MMYAQRFADGPRFHPVSLGAAIAVNGAFVAALLLANPDLVSSIPKPPMTIIDILPDPKPTAEPSPKPRSAEPRPQPTDSVVTPVREIETPFTIDNPVKGETIILQPAGPIGGTGTEPYVPPADPPIPPTFIAAREDPRYLADFQPPYPDYERDAGREDVVKLRIRIGADGRVKQIERLAGGDAFARVAIAHALAKWRFKPATRGGVPEESWKIMSVRFTLDR